MNEPLYFVIMLLVVLFVFILYLLNIKLKDSIKRINSDSIDFMSDSRRNFDAIVIGLPLLFDDRNKIEGNTVLQFTHNRRSLFASYLFLIHNFSYLREDGNGKVYIVSNMKEDMSVSIFDIRDFHRVVKMRLGVNSSLIRRLPILFYFKKFDGKRFFLDKKEISLKERIELFCQERNLKVIFLSQQS